ncbi:ECF transporter S component [Candidatus Bipolaricaulota bacterium]|nr:ECF transporter S component [Candidatus Bipolaricaulota bacterium]
MGGGDRHPAGLGRLSVRDLVVVALLAAVGGALSAYVGYLGNLVNRFVGVPFGAGQILAGLHVVWPLLAAALVGRFGAATLTGLAKGAVEFLMGGTHGVVILLVSAVQGAFVDLGMSLDPRRRLWGFLLSGTVASASNVFVFQALYFSGVPVGYILIMAGLAGASGLVLGGWLAHDLLAALRRAGLAHAPHVQATGARAWLAGGLALVFLAGGVGYYLAVYRPLSPGAVQVEGRVERPFSFRYQDWAGQEMTVRAALSGAVTYVPEQEYTGIPVEAILARAGPKPGAQVLIARARDGYQAEFPLAEVTADTRVLVVRDGSTLRLVAKGYPGSLWVRDLAALIVR